MANVVGYGLIICGLKINKIMIESKEEFNVLINGLKAKRKENKLGKSLQTKLRAFEEVESLINNLTIPVVVQQSELLKCDQVCDWISIGYAGNGHDECKTCGKTRAFS